MCLNTSVSTLLFLYIGLSTSRKFMLQFEVTSLGSVLHLWYSECYAMYKQYLPTAEFQSKDFFWILSILWINIEISMQFVLSISLQVIILNSDLKKVGTSEQSHSLWQPDPPPHTHSQKLHSNELSFHIQANKGFWIFSNSCTITKAERADLSHLVKASNGVHIHVLEESSCVKQTCKTEKAEWLWDT